MSDALFVTQKQLETWVESGGVTFDNNVLTLSASQVSYVLATAVRITGLLDGEDTQGLLKKRVWRVKALEDLGAEVMQGSVLLGETAYACEDGYLGEQRAATSVAAPAKEPAPDAEEQAEPKDDKSELDLLTDFFLKHM